MFRCVSEEYQINETDSQSSMAIRTACPPLNQPLSDQPETRTMNIREQTSVATKASYSWLGLLLLA